MDSKLSNRLFKKFKFLRKKEMPDGFCCGDGWYNIIHNMCIELRDLHNLSKDFAITKVFDKHGDMMVHSKNGNNQSRYIINEACEFSESICDKCGNNKSEEMCEKCKTKKVNILSSEDIAKILSEKEGDL